MNKLNKAIKTLNGQTGEWLRELRTYRRQDVRAFRYSQMVYDFSDRLKIREKELERLISRMKSKLNGKCAWKDEGDYWESSCGEHWGLEDGTPSENNMKYCHGCGKEIE